MGRYPLVLTCCVMLVVVFSAVVTAENIALMEYGGVTYSTTTYGNVTPEPVFDNVLSTSIALRVPGDVYIVREWEQDVVIDFIRVHLHTTNYAPDFDLEIWEYGMWKKVAEIRDNSEQIVEISGNGARTRKIRYKPLSFNPGNWHNVYEIVVGGTIDAPFVPRPEEFKAVKQQTQVLLNWQAPVQTKEGAEAVSYQVLRAEYIEGELGVWQTIATGLTDFSWSGALDGNLSYAYSVRAVDKWGHFSELAPWALFEPTGVVTGRVVASDGYSLSDVLIQVAGTQLIAKSDSDGKFLLSAVPIGTRELEAMKAGYLRKKQTVLILPTENTEVEFVLTQAEEIPSAPGFLSVETQNGQIVLTWNPGGQSQYGAITYNVYRSELPNLKTRALTPQAVNLNETSWADPSAIPGKVYYYAVTAVSPTYQESLFSNEIKASAPVLVAPLLSKPEQYAVLYNEPAIMSWQPLDGVSNYIVEYSKSAKFPAAQTQRRTIELGTEFCDPALENGNWYWRVQAYFENGTVSRFSEVGSFSMVNASADYVPAVVFLDIWPKIVGQEEFANIHYVLHAVDLSVSISVYDLNGRVVKTFLQNYQAGSGHHEFSWDGRDAQGRRLRNGIYLIHLRADGLGKSYQIKKKIIVMN